ncbi:hypothetical protein BDC45DRAFT_537666 [Circinella umbellata]|nr:hypothetical protein BDC45DRAFT_537666 [Circinella umbellata]
MTPAILELTTMSISNEYHVNSVSSNQPDNAKITSKNDSSFLDPNNNPIYDLAKAMFASSSGPEKDYDTFLEKATQDLIKIRNEHKDTEASRHSTKNWKIYTRPNISSSLSTQSTLQSTQQSTQYSTQQSTQQQPSSLFLSSQAYSTQPTTQEFEQEEEELDSSFPPSVVASQPTQQEASQKRKKDKEKKKKKKKFKPGFM